jgi:transposase
VPCQHARAQVRARVAGGTVELFLLGQRIASHVHSSAKGQHTTTDAHMPPAHREVVGWNADTFSARAAAVGPCCAALVARLLQQGRHPQMAFRSCLGVRSLGDKYGAARLEAAAARALKHSAVSWKSVQVILNNGLDVASLEAPGALELPEQENLRGAAYYQSNQLH